MARGGYRPRRVPARPFVAPKWQHVTVSAALPPLPADLLHAVTEQSGRIALVIGAGCSLEAPTGLQLATTYSCDVYRQLIHDGLLTDGECESPDDLSALASAVWDKHADQSPVVERLPRNAFRHAQPNHGYLMAAALLRERAVSAVLTVNFDLAMTTALGRLSATEVGVIPGPSAAGQLGSATVIYLHRNVDEVDPNRWILRRETLDNDWRDGWEDVVTQRVMSCPVVVFAGLGSPAAVLTETVARVRAAITASHRAYVVDPAVQTEFQGALALPPEAHIQLGWCDFMELLGARLVEEFRHSLDERCIETCSEHGWDGEAGPASGLCDRLHSIGLVHLGALRAAWLLDSALYSPDDARRGLIADLLLGVGLVERQHGAEAHFDPDGTVRLYRDGGALASFLAASGQGVLRWNAIEARVLKLLDDMRGVARPRAALLSGISGGRPNAIAAPEDVIGDWASDITQGDPRPELVTVDEIRADATQSQRLVA